MDSVILIPVKKYIACIIFDYIIYILSVGLFIRHSIRVPEFLANELKYCDSFYKYS